MPKRTNLWGQRKKGRRPSGNGEQKAFSGPGLESAPWKRFFSKNENVSEKEPNRPKCRFGVWIPTKIYAGIQIDRHKRFLLGSRLQNDILARLGKKKKKGSWHPGGSGFRVMSEPGPEGDKPPKGQVLSISDFVW